jgi:hypothetical protein
VKRKSSDVALTTPAPNQKTKNSASEKRGSIVKSIDKLASSIAADEAASTMNSSNAATASIASMMQAFSGQMQMQMQMQQMQQMQMQMQMQSQMANSNKMMKAMLKQLKKQKKKHKKKRSRRAFTLESTPTVAGNSKKNSSSSSSYFFPFLSITWKSLLAPWKGALKRSHSPLTGLPQRSVNVRNSKKVWPQVRS